MAIIKTILFSLRVSGRTIELVLRRLEKPAFKIYKLKHENHKSVFYRPIRWEYAIDLYRRGLSLHYKRDL